MVLKLLRVTFLIEVQTKLMDVEYGVLAIMH